MFDKKPTVYQTRRSLALSALAAVLASGPSANAAGRTVAVLEFRAGVHSAQGIASLMAERIQRQTSLAVISPVDARRKLGAGLEAVIARCNGAAPCIAELGRKLAADEVILVGLSELGDLILAIQRIDVATGGVLARLADSVQRRRHIRPVNIDRYLRRLLPRDDFLRYGLIVVRSDRVGDQVSLDDLPRGRTPLAPIKVPAPGRYRVQVRRPGHYDFNTRLDVVPDSTVEVTPTLAPLGGNERRRWYEHWWVWAIVGGVVAGGVTAVAVVTATRPPDNVDAVLRLDR
jgi:hypothetical protein